MVGGQLSSQTDADRMLTTLCVPLLYLSPGPEWVHSLQPVRTQPRYQPPPQTAAMAARNQEIAELRVVVRAETGVGQRALEQVAVANEEIDRLLAADI